MVLGTLPGHEKTDSPSLEGQPGGADLGDQHDTLKASTEPNEAEVQARGGAEGVMAATDGGRKRLGLIAVVFCVFALLASGGALLLWKRYAGRAIERL